MPIKVNKQYNKYTEDKFLTCIYPALWFQVKMVLHFHIS